CSFMAKRPLGVTILAILYWIYAILIALFWTAWDNIVNDLEDNGDITASEADALLNAGWFILVVALFFFLVGLGLFKLWNIARILAIILAVFQLLAFPIGTIIGAIIIWYLLKGSTGDAFTR
ncbi:MAG: hypothetical protein ACXADX_17065, partial [Candidatus Hodarchaeales archaeon]